MSDRASTEISAPLSRHDFPQTFLWGAATSAYQIEGSPLADNAGPSIWHDYSRLPGRVTLGHNGDVACDHYRRMLEDVRLMSELGLSAYRFSIAWPRVMPEGTGRVNAAGLAFYSRLVDTLREYQIQPFPTLHHWDLPSALQAEGGWLHPDSANWFAEYAGIVSQALGDRIDYWTTLNEPWVIANHGYLEGIHAPGRNSPDDVPAVCHNLLMAHGQAVRAIRRTSASQVGIVVNLTSFAPASERSADVDAARRMQAYVNQLFLDPILSGEYPREYESLFGQESRHSAADLTAIAEPIDFVGVNYYMRFGVRHDEDVPVTRATLVNHLGAPVTEMGWEVYPDGLREVLVETQSRYGDIPLFITENGAAYSDQQAVGGIIQDDDRVAYLRDHFHAAGRALQEGVPLRGYFVWSLLDNFEWQYGYTKRFGLFQIDANTQDRVWKRSAQFYRQWLRGECSFIGRTCPSS